LAIEVPVMLVVEGEIEVEFEEGTVDSVLG
jgi:hypothetical protein